MNKVTNVKAIVVGLVLLACIVAFTHCTEECIKRGYDPMTGQSIPQNNGK